MTLGKGKLFVSLLAAAGIGAGGTYAGYELTEQKVEPVATAEPVPTPSPSPSPSPLPTVAATPRTQTPVAEADSDAVRRVIRATELAGTNQSPEIVVISLSGNFAKAAVARSGTYFMKKVDGIWVVVEAGNGFDGDTVGRLRDIYGFPQSVIDAQIR